MVLIADCGSTKIDWCVLNGDKLEKRFFSTGVNALLMPEEKIRETFEKELAPEVKDFSIDEVYYYGAGCLSDEICSNVSRSIAACVPGAKTISVNSDLLAAARALCGTEPGMHPRHRFKLVLLRRQGNQGQRVAARLYPRR